MDYRIAGIPCRVELVSIEGKYVPAKVNADPDDCYEAEYPEVLFVVKDRRGYEARWLADKLTESEIADIERRLLNETDD